MLMIWIQTFVPVTFLAEVLAENNVERTSDLETSSGEAHCFVIRRLSRFLGVSSIRIMG